MKKYILLFIGYLGIFSLSAFTSVDPTNIIHTTTLDNEITAIITKSTTEKELIDIQRFFKDNGIELELKNVKFNTDNQITAINIIIKQGTNKSQYSSSSNLAIPDIELGIKNGSLFVTTKSNSSLASLKNNIHINQMTMPNIDSLLQKNGFAFDFDFDQDAMKDQMTTLHEIIKESFSDSNSNVVINGINLNDYIKNTSKKTTKYNFVDNPDINKLIIIDGKESDFKTLDKLATNDQLDIVDFLKSKTAISIYGKKAKDGAIIVTTKK